MSAALLGNISLFGVLTLAVLARAFEGFGRRAMAIGPAGALAALMFILSTFCMNAWMEVDGLENQLFLWRYGLLIDAGLYLVVLLFMANLRLWFTTLAVLTIAGLHTIAISDAEAGPKQIAESLQIAFIAALSGLCFLNVKRDDLIGLLLWGVLAINEVIAALFYADCQFAHGMFGTREEGAACVQVYGFDPTWAAVYVSLAFCVPLLFRWFRQR